MKSSHKNICLNYFSLHICPIVNIYQQCLLDTRFCINNSLKKKKKTYSVFILKSIEYLYIFLLLLHFKYIY